MQVSATEFKNNMGKYLSMAGKRDIYITKNGQRIAKLTNPAPDRVALLDSLVGIVSDDGITLADAKKERLERL